MSHGHTALNKTHVHGPECVDKPPTEVKCTFDKKSEMRVTLVSGFLGSGKTSLLNHILTSKDHKIRCAVIVNEISEFNIDALAVEGGGFLQKDEKMVEMSNGCICCSLSEDLVEQLAELHSSGFDATLIESSGLSEPLQVAETFFHPFHGPDAKPWEEPKVLQNFAPLDNCVTVVDAGSLLQHMQTLEATQNKTAQPHEQRSIATLMFDQLEFANVVILNKVDTIDEMGAVAGKGDVTADSLITLIQEINPRAEVIPASHSKVPLEKIVDTGNFSEHFASESQGEDCDALW